MQSLESKYTKFIWLKISKKYLILPITMETSNLN